MHPDGQLLTSWQLIVDANCNGSPRASEFARRYGPVVRAYLASRWRGIDAASHIDDATQDVFLECFRQGGVLDNVARKRPSSFRGFLLGVTRNVARRFEQRRGRSKESPMDTALEREVECREGDPNVEFERKWARSMVADALQRASSMYPDDRTRELFELRFLQNLPIRAIAVRWQLPSEEVHRTYARARRRFQHALRAVVAQHDGLDTAAVDDECRRLLSVMQ